VHPRFRHFAAPFVITVAAACGSPQPQPPPQPKHEIISNPPPPIADAGVEEQPADAALPNMPEERDPISGEPAPSADRGSEAEPFVTANPPSLTARVIAFQVVSDGVMVTINRGTKHGVAAGFVATFYRQAGVSLGSCTISKVTGSSSTCKVSGLSVDQVKAATRIAVRAP
jgi:hypothetical protein